MSDRQVRSILCPAAPVARVWLPSRSKDVIVGAVERVERCECGVGTSCYSCLRRDRNGRLRDWLSRRAPSSCWSTCVDVLTTAGPTDGPLDAEWQSLVDHALTEREREVLMGLATEGLPAPSRVSRKR